MVGDHVAQCAGGIVIIRSLIDSLHLRGGDLYMVDVTPVPDRLEDSVAKAKDEDVLDRLFAEIMVDAINLPLAEHLLDFGIQAAGRFEIIAERLLDNHATPMAVHFL